MREWLQKPRSLQGLLPAYRFKIIFAGLHPDKIENELHFGHPPVCWRQDARSFVSGRFRRFRKTVSSRKNVTTRADTSPGLLASGRPIDQEIIQPSASLNLRSNPPGLLATAGPGLHWVRRISILRRHGRVGAARPTKARRVVGPTKLTQPLLEPGCFRLQFSSELEGHFFMELPQFIHGHRIQVVASHDTPPMLFEMGRWHASIGQMISSVAC
jgi:hypothetical protein